MWFNLIVLNLCCKDDSFYVFEFTAYVRCKNEILMGCNLVVGLFSYF